MNKEYTTQKYRDDYYRISANIDLDAIRHNVEELKKGIKPGVRCAAVIKTDAYGHGAVYVAKALDDLVDAYCTATAPEAFELRRHGVDKPIVVLSFVNDSDLEEMIEREVRVNIYRKELAKKLSAAAVKLGKTAMVHIQVDTGMGRLGFQVTEEAMDTVREISQLPNLEIEGVCTHFASSDEVDKSYANMQYEKFIRFCEGLKARGVEIPVWHCSNSAAAMEMPGANLNMVRLGIAIYGYYPSDEVVKTNHDLRPALELVSHIIHLKTLEAGCGISYGSTYITSRPTRVATIPVGYGDGYPRALSNKGWMLIRGKKAPILGRVCMDLCMVDVTDIPDVSIGDRVTVIGRDGEYEISADTIGKLSGSFHYEVLCDLTKRVPKVYFRRGEEIGARDFYYESVNEECEKKAF